MILSNNTYNVVLIGSYLVHNIKQISHFLEEKQVKYVHF
jgi:hypothetical protein